MMIFSYPIGASSNFDIIDNCAMFVPHPTSLFRKGETMKYEYLHDDDVIQEGDEHYGSGWQPAVDSIGKLVIESGLRCPWRRKVVEKKYKTLGTGTLLEPGDQYIGSDGVTWIDTSRFGARVGDITYRREVKPEPEVDPRIAEAEKMCADAKALLESVRRENK